jgi:uncharacterized protein YqeY
MLLLGDKKEIKMSMELLRQRSKELRLARDPLGGFLNTVLSEALMLAKNDKNREATDTDAINAIRKNLKQNAENQNLMASRPDMMEKLTREKEILESLLPVAVNEATVLETAQKIVGDNPKSPKLMGGIMKALTEQYGDSLDRATASAWVKNWLNS